MRCRESLCGTSGTELSGRRLESRQFALEWADLGIVLTQLGTGGREWVGDDVRDSEGGRVDDGVCVDGLFLGGDGIHGGFMRGYVYIKGGHPQFKSATPQYCGQPNRLRSCGLKKVAEL